MDWVENEIDVDCRIYISVGKATDLETGRDIGLGR